MKYTVTIRQPVPADLQPRLSEELAGQFGLSPEQALRLASRRSGRLMKPTTRRRAERLLEVFGGVGAQVALEEVREDTLFGMPVGPEGAGLPGRTAPGSVAILSAATPRSAPPSTPVASSSAEPDHDFAAPGFSALEGGPGDFGGAVLPIAGGLTSGGLTADDAWADFTGSLGAETPAAAPTAARPPSPYEPAAPDTLSEERGEEPAGPRRSSLSRRVLLSALLPLALFTAVTLGFLLYALPRAQRQLIVQNAQAVAVAVGSNLDVTDQDTVYTQLDSLMRRSAVGFVQVNLPDGTRYFRSKNAAADGLLSEKVGAWVKAHPSDAAFVERGSPADSYRDQLALLKSVGAGESAQAKTLQASINDPANQKSTIATYLLSSINVNRNAKGERVVGDGIGNSQNANQLYSVVVGVPGDEAFTLLRNTLLLVLGVALLAFALTALLTARTARRVVEPIERLVRAADAISMGDLARPVPVERNDEVGDLAQALERMRLSLDAAMERLRRRRAARGGRESGVGVTGRSRPPRCFAGQDSGRSL